MAKFSDLARDDGILSDFEGADLRGVYDPNDNWARYRFWSGRRKKSGAFGPGPCPECGAETVLQFGILGDFYGCKEYPLCRGIREITEEIDGDF